MHLLALFLLSIALTLGADEGPIIDPNGGHHLGAYSGDHHCTIDPNGGCVGGFANTDGRSILDPIGGTATASSDRGAGLDPNG